MYFILFLQMKICSRANADQLQREELFCNLVSRETNLKLKLELIAFQNEFDTTVCKAALSFIRPLLFRVAISVYRSTLCARQSMHCSNPMHLSCSYINVLILAIFLIR
jgi:hypothetical protein